jgi:hypothetical protein
VRDRGAEMLRIGADREADPIRLARRHLDHAPTGRRHLDRDLGHAHLGQPLEPAREPVALDGVATQVRLQRRQMALEARDGIERLPDPLHRRVAATDAEHRASAALDLQRERRRRRHRRVARDGVRHSRPEADPRRRLRGQHELSPHLGCEVLAVGKDQAREAEILGHARVLRGALGLRNHREADVHGRSLVAGASSRRARGRSPA